MIMSLPRLRPDQAAIAKHPARIKVLADGRRWGKTFTAGAICLSCANAGADVAWVVPTYKNARPIWKFAERMLQPVARAVKIQRSTHAVEFPTGGSLGIYTADNPVGILGNAFDVAVIEEAARISEDVWIETVYPTLADKRGRAYLISTPRGRNWFYREYMTGLDDGVNQMSWSAPTYANPNPNIQEAFRQAEQLVKQGRYSERAFRQEWLAEFLDDGGGVFRGVSEAATAPHLDKGLEGHQYIIGADWARTTDATWFAVLDVGTIQNVYNDRMFDTDYSTQRARLKALHERFNHAVIVAESNSMGLPNIEALQSEGVPVIGCQTTNATKAVIIDALALAFERREITIETGNTILIGELQAYEMERLTSGLIRYSAPEGLHDDGVIALALAYSGTRDTAGIDFA